MPSAIAARIALFFEWRVGQFLAGACFALAFAPYYYVLAFVLPILAYYHGLRTAPTLRIAIVRGFWFGYGFSIAGTYWIAFSLLVDADKFGWMIPFSVLGLSALMALWWAVQAYMYAKLRAHHRLHDALVFAASIMLIEYAKSFGIFGFPWNLNGYAFIEQLPFAQLASVAGVYGLGFVAVLVVVMLYHTRRHPRAAISAVVAVVLIFAWGLNRMQVPAESTDFIVRLVQPNIPQGAKWNAEAAREGLAKLAVLSKQGGFRQPDMVIWPETAITYTVTADTNWAGLAANMLPKDAGLITGAVRADEAGNVYNSVLFVEKGRLAASYDKHQLVPFGEFVPLRDVLPLDKITPGAQDFSKGPGPVTVHLAAPAPSMSPLVCYEAVFPAIATADTDRPDMLVNLTNDGWFGDSPGPYQHLAMARMRSIEQGLPLIRVANTGISAIIASDGRMLAHLSLNETGTLDRAVPQSFTSPLYARFASVWFMLPIVVLLHAYYTTRRRKG